MRTLMVEQVATFRCGLSYVAGVVQGLEPVTLLLPVEVPKGAKVLEVEIIRAGTTARVHFHMVGDAASPRERRQLALVRPGTNAEVVEWWHYLSRISDGTRTYHAFLSRTEDRPAGLANGESP